MRALVVVLVLATACTHRRKPPAPRPQLIEVVRGLADRACACNADRECMQPVRDDFDARKADLLAHGLTGAELATFDAELQRLRACGDAAGLTIWLH